MICVCAWQVGVDFKVVRVDFVFAAGGSELISKWAELISKWSGLLSFQHVIAVGGH